MNIIERADEFAKSRNVVLLFYNEDPTQFTPSSHIAHIDIVNLPIGPVGNELLEKRFLG